MPWLVNRRAFVFYTVRTVSTFEVQYRPDRRKKAAMPHMVREVTLRDAVDALVDTDNIAGTVTEGCA
jgi:hypothetical protein